MRTATACFALTLLAVASLSAQGDRGAAVVRNASKTYQALSSFQANFHQHFEDRSIDDLPDSRGVLYQEGKNHFAMRWIDPPKDAIVADGTKFWMYLPSTSAGKVMRFQQQAHPTYGSNLLGTFLDNAVDRYRITYLRSESVDGHLTDVVLMEPIAHDMPFARATIWFDRDLSLPRKLDIEELRDRRRILTLSTLVVNNNIPSDIFTCTRFPRGTTVVDQ